MSIIEGLQVNVFTLERKQTTGAGFLIFRKKENQIQVLFLQSKKDPTNWTPPKGHREEYESHCLETAVRETREECGLNAAEGDYQVLIRKEKGIVQINAIRNTYETPDERKDVWYFLGEVNDDAKVNIEDNDEVMDYKWCNVEEAVGLIIYEPLQGMLRPIYKYLNNMVPHIDRKTNCLLREPNEGLFLWRKSIDKLIQRISKTAIIHPDLICLEQCVCGADSDNDASIETDDAASGIFV